MPDTVTGGVGVPVLREAYMRKLCSTSLTHQIEHSAPTPPFPFLYTACAGLRRDRESASAVLQHPRNSTLHNSYPPPNASKSPTPSSAMRRAPHALHHKHGGGAVRRVMRAPTGTWRHVQVRQPHARLGGPHAHAHASPCPNAQLLPCAH